MLSNCGDGEDSWESFGRARRSNQSILKEISPEYSLEGLMLKLKLQSSGHLMRRTDSLEKTLMLGKIEGGRRRGWQRMRWLDGHHRLDRCAFEQALRVGDGQGSLASCSPWDHKELDMTEWLNWTELILPSSCYLLGFNMGHSPKSEFLNLLFVCFLLLIVFMSISPNYIPLHEIWILQKCTCLCTLYMSVLCI